MYLGSIFSFMVSVFFAQKYGTFGLQNKLCRSLLFAFELLFDEMIFAGQL